MLEVVNNLIGELHNVSIGSKFISDLDHYIRNNINSITCKEFAGLYFDFINSIKAIGGDTRNLTGLTELLFFRAFYHLNNTSMTRDGLTFEGKLQGTNRQPDLLVFKDTEPIMSVEVKSNYFNIKQDYGRHEEVVSVYPNIVTVTIAFTVENIINKAKIDNYISTSPFYQCLILDECDDMLVNKLDGMGLLI